jgi:hypothetical protein
VKFGVGDFLSVLLNFLIVGFVVWRISKAFVREQTPSGGPSDKDVRVLPDDDRPGSFALPALHERPRRARRCRNVAIARRLTILSGAKVARRFALAFALVQLGINQRGSCTITRIADGDSVSCHPYGRVRLLSIDAPELSNRELGTRARAELLSIMPVGTKVSVETDVRVKDQYGRLLAYLFPRRRENGQRAHGGEWLCDDARLRAERGNTREESGPQSRALVARTWASGEPGDFVCSPRDYRAGRCR